MNSPPKILVVDDTPRNVKLLADLLMAKGYAVTTAASGQQALASISSEPPDLVLLDVVMPEMSGYEVCQKIRAVAATAMLPVVMVTALDPTVERVKGIEAGADDFLSKPINQPELLARVKSLLRIKELHETVQAQARELADWNQTLQRRVEEQEPADARARDPGEVAGLAGEVHDREVLSPERSIAIDQADGERPIQRGLPDRGQPAELTA